MEIDEENETRNEKQDHTSTIPLFALFEIVVPVIVSSKKNHNKTDWSTHETIHQKKMSVVWRTDEFVDIRHDLESSKEKVSLGLVWGYMKTTVPKNIYRKNQVK